MQVVDSSRTSHGEWRQESSPCSSDQAVHPGRGLRKGCIFLICMMPLSVPRATTASLHRCESPKHIWMLQGTRGSQILGEGARRGCSQPWAGPGRWTADAVHEPSFLPLLHSLGLLLSQPQAHQRRTLAGSTACSSLSYCSGSQPWGIYLPMSRDIFCCHHPGGHGEQVLLAPRGCRGCCSTSYSRQDSTTHKEHPAQNVHCAEAEEPYCI